MEGLVHIYCGDGKGKTTAAVGLAVRAAGAGMRVLFVQFFKNDNSSELPVLRSCEQIEVVLCASRHGFFFNMDEAEKRQTRQDYTELFHTVTDAARNGADVLVLDEMISTCNFGMVPEEEVLEFLKTRPEGLEVVLTGRDPSERLLAAADYVTEMKKRAHPYDRGIMARRGIDY